MDRPGTVTILCVPGGISSTVATACLMALTPICPEGTPFPTGEGGNSRVLLCPISCPHLLPFPRGEGGWGLGQPIEPLRIACHDCLLDLGGEAGGDCLVRRVEVPVRV